MSTTSGPNVPLRIGKSYVVPAIETDASAVRFSVAPFMGTRSATPSSSRRGVVGAFASILPVRRQKRNSLTALRGSILPTGGYSVFWVATQRQR